MWNLVSYNDRVCCCFILFEWLLLLLLLPEPIIPVAKLRYKTDRPIYWWCDSRAINRQTDCQNQIIILIGYLYVFLVCVCVIFAYSVLVAIASNSYWIDIAGVLLLSKLLFQRQEESLMHHCSLMVPFDLRLNLFHLSIRLCLVSMKSSTWLFGNAAIWRRKKNCIAIVISQPSRSDMRDSSSEKIITFLDTLVVHYNYILRVNDFVSNFLLD